MDKGFSGYLESKQAGPLSCPICGQINTFEPRDSLAATRAVLKTTDPPLWGTSNVWGSGARKDAEAA
jgi:hypothetical protein